MTETANGRQPAEQAMDALGPAGWKPAPVHAAQARTAGVEITGKVSFRGKDYRLGKYAGENLMALLEFTAAQDAGLGTDDPAGMAAMMDWLRFCFILTPSCGQCEACDDERYAECGKLDEGTGRGSAAAPARCARPGTRSWPASTPPSPRCPPALPRRPPPPRLRRRHHRPDRR